MIDAPRIIRRLYRDRHGYNGHPAEEDAVAAAGSNAMYGELMPTATAQLLAYLNLRPDDVLYDLGSGVGKLVLQTAMSIPVANVVGIEMMPSRHAVACDALDEIERLGILAAQTCELWCVDFMRASLADATVIYTCSTAFPSPLMNRLTRKLARLTKLETLVTLRELEQPAGFDLQDVLQLDASWKRRSSVYVYRRSGLPVDRRK